MARKTQGVGALIATVTLTACSAATVAAPSTPEEALPAPRPALEVVEEFIDSFNAGDIEAALGMIDVIEQDITGSYVGPDGVEFLRFGEDSGRPWLANLMASGAQKANHECTVVTESPTEATVTCTFESRYSVREAVGAPALETTATFEVSDGYIVGLDEVVEAFGPNVGGGYITWMADAYPDDATLAETLEWATMEKAIASGEAEGRHVEEYAAYLEQNGCDMTGC